MIETLAKGFLGMLLASLATGMVLPTSPSWIIQCARQGLPLDWLLDQPIPSSFAQALVICMVNHVMTTPYADAQLQLLSSSNDDWCLPKDFLSENRTCASLHFDLYEPIRYCIEEEGFPALSSDAPYAEAFYANTGQTSSFGTSTFYLSSRLSIAMCGLLDGLRTNRGLVCLKETCRHASHAPSQTPSSLPSSLPSSDPSRHPSPSPSKKPSVMPSTVPTSRPSADPSPAPSQYPSVGPTPVASEQPSMDPTRETKSPSAPPSRWPSWYPTPAPTPEQSLGQGAFLNIKATLRVMLDGAQEVVRPLEDSVSLALQRAIQESFRFLPGFQRVNITSATRAPLENAPIVLVFRIVALKKCEEEKVDCDDPYAPSVIAREFRDVFEDAVQSGFLANRIRQHASRQHATSLLDVSPRPNSSNLMSSNSYIVAVGKFETSSTAATVSRLATSLGSLIFVMIALP